MFCPGSCVPQVDLQLLVAKTLRTGHSLSCFRIMCADEEHYSNIFSEVAQKGPVLLANRGCVFIP